MIRTADAQVLPGRLLERSRGRVFPLRVVAVQRQRDAAVRQACSMKHIFVSPHFDDAVGSCGGTISRLRREGADVVVYTIFGGEPSLPISPFAAELHAEWGWGCGEEPIAVRSREDATACRALDCLRESSAFTDAIYRQSLAGIHSYPDEKALFGGVSEDDSELHVQVASEIRERWPAGGLRFYFPLGVGHHVDHVIAFQAGLELNQAVDVFFYQDFFYTDWNCAHLEGRRIEPRVEPITPCDLERKITAFSHYRSQIPMLFGSDEGASSYFRAAARQVNGASDFGETFWRVISYTP